MSDFEKILAVLGKLREAREVPEADHLMETLVMMAEFYFPILCEKVLDLSEPALFRASVISALCLSSHTPYELSKLIAILNEMSHDPSVAVRQRVKDGLEKIISAHKGMDETLVTLCHRIIRRIDVFDGCGL
jgi:hypothetical protein